MPRGARRVAGSPETRIVGRTSEKASRDPSAYLHGSSPRERARLRAQALFLEPYVHDGLPLDVCTRLVEIGAGVGAQTEILLRRHPALHVTLVDRSAAQLAAAKRALGAVPGAKGRYALHRGDAARLDLPSGGFDGAFLCWILEHVTEPDAVLAEVRRLLAAGGVVSCTEVQNATLFLDPAGPALERFWAAFNAHQRALGGDPFVGARLGNLLAAAGFVDIHTTVKPFHLDRRAPVERAEMLAYWRDLLLSAAPGLVRARRIPRGLVADVRAELDALAAAPDAVFFYAFVRAEGRAP